jgi:hypothetical protein
LVAFSLPFIGCRVVNRQIILQGENMIKVMLGSLVVLALSVLLPFQGTTVPSQLSDNDLLECIGGCESCDGEEAGCGDSGGQTECIATANGKFKKVVGTGQLEAKCVVTPAGSDSCTPVGNALCTTTYVCTGKTLGQCTGCAKTSIKTRVKDTCDISGNCMGGGGG